MPSTNSSKRWHRAAQNSSGHARTARVCTPTSHRSGSCRDRSTCACPALSPRPKYTHAWQPQTRLGESGRAGGGRAAGGGKSKCESWYESDTSLWHRRGRHKLVSGLPLNFIEDAPVSGSVVHLPARLDCRVQHRSIAYVDASTVSCKLVPEQFQHCETT